MDSYGFLWVSEGSSEFRIQGTNLLQLFKSVGIPQEIPMDSYTKLVNNRSTIDLGDPLDYPLDYSGLQNTPKECQETPKRPSRYTKEGLKGSQEGPRGSQEGQKGSPIDPKMTPKCSQI